MSIPVYLSAFKAAGVYRVVFDKSTMVNVDTQILRMVVGYSEKGPFNTPVYVKDPQTFRAIFGDISKKLEKRGIFFHRLALQMLAVSPILCLNLKKFDGETVSGATINTDFNPKFAPIDDVKINVEDIYDTTRFWELSADKLNNLRTVGGVEMDQYINIATTNTKATSATYFIRKASGTKVSSYDLTVNDWYSDGAEEMPEYLEGHEQNLISDYFAEIYVFKGRFTASQILASETLKNYFIVSDEKDEYGNQMLRLRDKVFDAFGDPTDTLDALYADETSGALGHYIGALIPYFKNKQGVYASLDVLFNSDIDTHNMMMTFNTDLLDEELVANIDLSGRLAIPTNDAISSKKVLNSTLSLVNIYKGTATTTVLGNTASKVVSDTITFGTNVYTQSTGKAVIDFSQTNTKITGTLYVKEIKPASHQIILKQVGEDTTVSVYSDSDENFESLLTKFGCATQIDGIGTYYKADDAFELEEDPLAGPQQVITAINRLEAAGEDFTDVDNNLKVNFLDVAIVTDTKFNTEDGENSVYGSSVSFIDYIDDNWQWQENVTINGVSGLKAFICDKIYDKSLNSVLHVGDCLVAADGTNDLNGDLEIDDKDKDNYYDNVYVQEVDTQYDENGNFMNYYIIMSGEPLVHVAELSEELGNDIPVLERMNGFLIRIDSGLNKEIGVMQPRYLEGYTYKNDRPEGTGMYAKVQWQNFILSALTDYKGLRIGLLDKGLVDYRYVIDTFESYPVSSLKNVLSYLCKEKQSAFCIANFPAVQTFVKCPYTSFTDSKGVFNIDYVVEGYNKKKASAVKFSLPSDADGASFIAFYTPLKFSDGYVDTIVPPAGLVSNLFIEKYMSRQPYYIVAGPNYGNISASGLVGPDYRYSQEELYAIEPYGVNCMIYRPNFGTFINANQTAKQTPVSALSKVHVRELVIYLQDEIEKVLQSYQWEFNNARTRNAILDKANMICSLVASNGGLQAYKNVMDESNNTPEIIDNEMAVISTHIEPGMGCGKMVQELTLYRTGQMSAAISD